MSPTAYDTLLADASSFRVAGAVAVAVVILIGVVVTIVAFRRRASQSRQSSCQQASQWPHPPYPPSGLPPYMQYPPPRPRYPPAGRPDRHRRSTRADPSRFADPPTAGDGPGVGPPPAAP